MKTMEKSKMRKLVVSMLIGGVVGFLGAMGLITLIDSGVLGSLNTSREIAALVGMLYVVTGGFVAIGLMSPEVGAKFLNVEDADELREQAKMLRYSSFGMVGLGAALMLLAFAAPLGPVAEIVALGVVLVLIALSWLTSRQQMQAADELMRAVSRESTSTAFYMLFVAGGGWSILAHLGYLPAPAPLDWVTMFAAVMLIGAFWVCGKRGMLMPR